METSPTERRSAQRFSISLPVVMTVFDPTTKRMREESTFTRDASNRGIYLYAETVMQQGNEFEFTLFLHSDYPSVRYKARVVRVEPLEDGSFGIAPSRGS